MQKQFICAILVVLGFSVGAPVQAQTDEEAWEFRLTPYVWLPTIDGTLKYNLPPGSGGSPNISVGPTDWLDLLNVGALVAGSAKKGRFSVFSDLVYLSMTSKNDGTVDSVRDGGGLIPIDASLVLNTRSDLDGMTWTLTAGYEIGRNGSAGANIFAGVRYFGVDVSTRWDMTADITTPGGSVVLPSQGSIGSDTDLWDGIVGVRGELGTAGASWTFPYYLDVGAGDSNLTWNAMLGASRGFQWGDLLLVYRHLDYDQDANSLLQDFSFSGPAIGARFRF